MALIATSIYTLDRILRFSRFVFYLPTSTATLTPLPSSNATRVTLSRSMARAAPGSHAFLYIPSIRGLQTHPFTMVSRDPVEFVISARDGFTKDLFKAACEKPGRKVRAGIEGAYGHVPDVTGYERVMLFAGGSGATFAFALAVEWARTSKDVERKESVDFIWSVRTVGKLEPVLTTDCFNGWPLIHQTDQLEGFTAELAILEAHPRISMHVHITKLLEALPEKPVTLSSLDDISEVPIPGDNKDVKISAIARVGNRPLPSYAVPGRPDILSTIHGIANECDASQRIIVAACGPAGLSNDVRDAVKSCTKVDGPSLDLHLEAFGW